MKDGAQPLYNKDTSGCCAAGLPFDTHNKYCCYDGIHEKSAGYCGPWKSNAANPTCYDCSTGRRSLADLYSEEMHNAPVIESAERAEVVVEKPHSALRVVAVPDNVPFDTRATTNTAPCYTATSTEGCLNMWPFNYNTQYPCGNWITPWSGYNCCHETPYNNAKDTCCYDDLTKKYTVVVGNGHACSCIKKDCNPGR